MKQRAGYLLAIVLLLAPPVAFGQVSSHEGLPAHPSVAPLEPARPSPIQLLPELAGSSASGAEPRAACTITNIQGELAAGFLNWATPGGGIMVYFDPAGSGGSGDPGCAEANPYPFLIETVEFILRDASGFLDGGDPIPPEQAEGTLTFTVDIACPNQGGDPCSEPGTEVFVSDPLTLIIPPVGPTHLISVPANVCVDGPFFVSIHWNSWTGLGNRVPSVQWDAVARPACRQWISQDGGASWTDHEEFFGASTGWTDMAVIGNTQDACGPSGNCALQPGACCLPDGSCVDAVTSAECTALGGEFQGDGSDCGSVSCPQPPTGACCEGGGVCSNGLSMFDCTGAYLGDDTVCGGDCNADGTNDACEIDAGTSQDCQPNGIPDDCDIDQGTSRDINANGIPDECECREGNGDIDDDGDIDIGDHGIGVDCIDGPDVPHGAGCEAVDMDGDCDVDLVDHALFQLVFGTEVPTVIFRAELAGNSLSEYPFFEYVKAFNENATMEVAIDPTRFGDIVGLSCDIYVVEAKTAAEWVANPALTDVTAGGAQTESFGGTTIQENTFLVTGPFELDADAGIGIGVGYDVVLDCDQDGELTGGDYIDGLSNEAGMYAVHDVAAMGPLAVTELLYSIDAGVGASFGIPANKLAEDLYFPSNIASMGQLPIVIVSRGNGHNYQWYDHIGFHMASYGYIVMSHDNDTEPGVAFAAVTTQGHTDAFIDQAQAGAIAGGALVGHLDSSRIIWIGHSRGAEGIAIAYDNILVDGSYVPTHYDIEDLVLLSSMAPTDFLGPNEANPHGANYHLWTASGDSDVSGVPSNDIAQTFHLHDRATGYRHSTCIQGAGHGDLHNASAADPFFSGPCPIGRAATNQIQRGFFLPLIKYYAEGNIPALDFLWRQWERFRPIGAPDPGFCSATGGPAVVVNNTSRDGGDLKFVIDDFQTNTSSGTSSSGGAVTFTVTNLTEDRLDDNNTDFTWTASDPMNGFTYGRSSDTTRGVVFDWNGTDRFYEQGIIASERDFTDDLYLSFRAAQGTRHPNTVAVLGDLNFSVTLRDGSGTSSSINLAAYGIGGTHGGGIEEPYQRTGAGTGTGWGAEFETIRIRLTDFLTNGPGLDLTDVVAVRFDVGPSWGSNEGRIGVDDIELTNDQSPFFVPLTIDAPFGTPEYLSFTSPTVVLVEIQVGGDDLVDGSALVHYRYTGGSFSTAALVPIGGGLYEASLPPPDCDDTPEFYFSAEGVVTGPVFEPPGAPATVFTALVGDVTGFFADDFETDMGWTVTNVPSGAFPVRGFWEREVPLQCVPPSGDPAEDFDGSGTCWLTENNNAPTSCNTDVDNGTTILTSPTIDITGAVNPILRYARWFTNDDGPADPDTLDVQVSDDDGATWVLVESVHDTVGWVHQAVNLGDFGISFNNQFRVRFSAEDLGGSSKVEAAVDAVEIFGVECE